MIKLIKGSEVYYNLSNKEGVLKNVGVCQAVYDMITRGNLDITVCNVTHIKINDNHMTLAMLKYLFSTIVDVMKEEIQNEGCGDNTPIVFIADPLIYTHHTKDGGKTMEKIEMKEILMRQGFVNIILDGSLKSANNINVMVLNDDAGEAMINHLIAKKVVTRTSAITLTATKPEM